METRFAEEWFPMKEISEISAKEKSIRHGHISSLHIWWARRPLASSRAMSYAALIHTPKEIKEVQKKKDFIVELAKWENSHNQSILEIAVNDILSENGGKAPKVLDPFAGGGSIPLEAMRLGCQVYSSDYNPVSVLIQKCTLEYPLKYSKSYGSSSHSNKNGESKLQIHEGVYSELLEKVVLWGDWILKEARKELSQFYPLEDTNLIPAAFIWCRTLRCQNPPCGAMIPLLRQYWLAKSPRKSIFLLPTKIDKQIEFKVVEDNIVPKGFDPNKGTISRAIVTCAICGSVIDDKNTRRLFLEGNVDQRLVAVILYDKSGNKIYRVATPNDIMIFKNAEGFLNEKRKTLSDKWGFDPVPDEPLPSTGTLGFRVQRYNMTRWGDLFNSRQKLSLITFVEKIRQAHSLMIQEGYDEGFAKAIVSYLAFGLDRLADFGSSLCVLNVARSSGVAHTFGRQTLQMVWDYAESNPLNPFGAGWVMACEKNRKWIEHVTRINNRPPIIEQHSATSIPYSDNFFDAVFTDPPYYDNVPYSHLSDFFYVWLKRSVGDLYPELFSTPLTPKSKEIVAYGNIPGGIEAGKNFFEDSLKKSFREISRVIKPNGICVIVYAHKSTAGWESLINSLLDSGLVVTAAWPINTEMKGRLRATESAALTSSIYLVSGKYNKKPIGFYRDIKIELKKHLDNELEKLWNEGVSGADFFVSAIGSSIEVFGMYVKIIDDEGKEIRADKLLEEIQGIVTDYAVKQVLHDGFAAEISQMSRFYLLWRWAYGEDKIHFDDARKLSQSAGVDLSSNWNKGFIRKDKEFIRLLGPNERKEEQLVDSKEMIDVLHLVLQLWNKGKNNDIIEVLDRSGFGNSDVFYRVAQAISELLPNESKEKKWLEGFLAGKSRIFRELKAEAGQQRLFG